MRLRNTITPGQLEPGCNGNEEVLYILGKSGPKSNYTEEVFHTFECASWLFFFNFSVHLYFLSLANESHHFHLSFLGVVLVLELDLFFSCFVPCPCSSVGVPLVFLLDGTCCGPATEVTAEVKAPEFFLSGFACHSWLVAILVFGSLESFSITDGFHLLNQCSHFVYKLGNHLGFCG